ncbi:hypothetical protein KTH_62860 [Thermosporothrix hazakensis]|nr:hypothetical protein KTH_62860 [Thermosporothrix hazakensis]
MSYLHLASEGLNWNEIALPGEGVTITQLAHKVAQVPVIANGGMHKPALTAEILEGGHGDLIALANPDWPRRLAEGQPIESFDHQMLEPMATIENALCWLARK